MDDAGGLRGFPALLDCPGADFLFTGGEVGHQAEEIVGALDEGRDAGVVDAEVLEEGFGFVGGQVDEFALDFGADRHVGGVVVGADELGDFLDERILFGGGEVGLGDVAGEENGFGGEELEELHHRDFLGGGRQRVGGFAGIEVGREFLEERDLDDGFLVAGLGLFLGLVDALGDGLEVGENEFGGDDLDVADGIDAAHGVDDVVVLEAADDLDDGVDLADGGEKLVAEAFALAGAGDEAGDVDELDGGGDDDLGLRDRLEDVGAFVGDDHDADVGVDGAERVVRSLGLAGAREGVEESGFAHVGQADDASFKHK